VTKKSRLIVWMVVERIESWIKRLNSDVWKLYPKIEYTVREMHNITIL